MYYIAKNPSTPKVYKKLIQSCKYFSEKMPILVVTNMYGNTTICSNEYCFRDDNKKCCVNIDLNKLSSKIWITNKLILDEENISTFASLIIPKLFRWNIIELNVITMDIMFNDFRICAPFLTDILFWGCRIINDDGNVVMLDKILEIIPHIKNFDFRFKYDFSMINATTMKNMCKLKNLQSISLFDIPEIFNVDDLSTFIKGHPDTEILFSFKQNISESYRVQLDSLIDTVIKFEASHCVIKYYGQNQERYKIMNKNVRH
uniref:Uncharacterized protein n=1 Tax=Panagrolaimus superbus TaxID=310955 RepID=A0A914Z6G1_9BILA